MEDLKNTREEQSHQEVSHKDIEQTFKESTPPPLAQSSTPLNCASPHSGSSPVLTPCPASGGPTTPPVGGNNAKRTTVANGQPSSGASARYVPREVPPRFRNQQEPKVLLRRGQSLVGGATGDTSPPIHTAEVLNANSLHSSDPDVDPTSPLASQSSATSTYANSTWGPGSGAPPLSQGMDKIVVDGSDLEAWPSLAEGIRPEEEPFAQSSVTSCDGSQGMQGSESEGAGLCEVGGAFSPDEYAVGGVVWGPSSHDVGGASGVADQSFSSERQEEELQTSNTPVGVADPDLIPPGSDLGRVRAESALFASQEASSSPSSAQDGGAWEDNTLEREAGPKQAGTDVIDDHDCSELEKAEQVPASNNSTPAPRTERWGSGAAGGEAAGVWAPSGDVQGSWGSGGNDSGSCGVSQGGWGKEACGVSEQAAVWPCDSPVGGASGAVSENFVGSLQDPEMFSSSPAALDNQKGVDEWEGSEGGSAGHGGSEDETRAPDVAPDQRPCPEVALQSMLSCSHLDPRVLSNTGWGQTQIKQGVAWDLEADGGAESAGSLTEHAQNDPKGPNPPQRPVPAEGSQVRGSRGQGWGADGAGWGEQKEERWQGSEGEWRNQPEQGGRSGVWAESAEEQRGTRWGENRSDGGRWGQRGSEWAEERGSRQGGQDEASWGSSEDEGRRGWGGKDTDGTLRQHKGWTDTPPSVLKHPTAKGPNQQQAPGGPARGPADGRARPAGPAPPLGQSSGWTSGPIPLVSPAAEPSGWEEPSPQSISRRLEIDDGTAAWGDPATYHSKAVSMWEKSAPRQRPPPARPPPGTLGPPARDKPTAWDRGGGLLESVDNGTAAWGKSFDSASAWRDPEDSGKGSGWGSSHASQAKSGSKSVQEGWGDDVCVSSRHSSWEEEEGSLGVWASRGGQSSSSSFPPGGWSQGQGGKRTGGKGALKGNGGDSWTGPVSQQISSMGITDEEGGSSSDRPRRGTADLNGDSRKGGRGAGSFRSQGSKDAGPGDTGPYFDKVGSHGMFGAGASFPQLRGMQQHGVHSVNPSPGIRAQVPHQFLPPQVSGSMLKPMAPPGGGVFPAQLSPQHIAVLSGIHPQMQQFQLACQLLLQQQQQQQQQQHFLSQRKFPPPLRQQHDPQQLARIMTLLQQQRSQQGVGGPKLSPSHLGGGAPKQPEGALLHPALGGSVDLHPKTPPVFSVFGSGAELESVMGGAVGGLKDAGGSQSRFKWMMEAGHPLAPAPPDPMLHKNGLLHGQMKLRADSPYSQYDLLGAENLGVASQNLTDTWHRTAKLGSAPTWPPEFQPGVPWKGVQSPDPDPYMTPSGMLGSPILSDTDHQLLQDNTESNPSLNTLLPSPGAWPYSASDNMAKFSEFKSSWPPEPIGHNKSWKTNRNSSHLPRPPPGLTNQKQSSSSLWSGAGPRMPKGWGPGARSQDAPFGTETAWSGGSSTGSSWLLLRNLTPQIDGSTLRTICLQHGPLMTFHLGLTQGSALIRYCSPHEAAKAQTALHMCVLGNTTILAEFVSEEEVARYFTHSQSSGVAGSAEGSSVPDPAVREVERSAAGGVRDVGGGGGAGDAAMTSPSTTWQGLDISGSLTGSSAMEGPGLTLLSQWSNSGADGQGGGVWGGVASGYHGSSLWGASQMEDSPSGLFPGDLLGGGADTL